jgi:hypothetical protein
MEAEKEMGVALRDENGRFLTSGNPAGRPPGSRNKATLVKEFIEEKLTGELENEAIEVMHTAIRKAKAGDNAMIKLLLGEMMSAVRNGTRTSDEGAGGGIRVVINNMTQKQQDEVAGVTIEQHEDDPQGA